MELSEIGKRRSEMGMRESQNVGMFSVGDVIHIERWYYGEDTDKFETLGNCKMVDVKLPITKIMIDHITGMDWIQCGAYSTSANDIANKGLINVGPENKKMRQMTIKDFDELNFGKKVYHLDSRPRGLRYVGRMPGCKNYWIFCDGEYLTYFHNSHSLTNWYIGDWDDKFVGNLMLKNLEEQKKDIKRIYLIEEED